MNLEKFFELVLSNPNNVTISYSNVDGKETLNVNGVELTEDKEDEEESFDDSGIKEQVRRFVENIHALSDEEFNHVTIEIGEHIDLETFNELLNQTEYSKEDADIVEAMISFASTIMHEYLTNKILALQEIVSNL